MLHPLVSFDHVSDLGYRVLSSVMPGPLLRFGMKRLCTKNVSCRQGKWMLACGIMAPSASCNGAGMAAEQAGLTIMLSSAVVGSEPCSTATKPLLDRIEPTAASLVLLCPSVSTTKTSTVTRLKSNASSTDSSAPSTSSDQK